MQHLPTGPRSLTFLGADFASRRSLAFMLRYYIYPDLPFRIGGMSFCAESCSRIRGLCKSNSYVRS